MAACGSTTGDQILLVKSFATHRHLDGGHTAVIEILLKARANVDAGDKNGRTSFHAAVFDGQVAAIDILLKAEANPNAKSKNGVRPCDIHPGFVNRHNDRSPYSKRILDKLAKQCLEAK